MRISDRFRSVYGEKERKEIEEKAGPSLGQLFLRPADHTDIP